MLLFSASNCFALKDNCSQAKEAELILAELDEDISTLAYLNNKLSRRIKQLKKGLGKSAKVDSHDTTAIASQMFRDLFVLLAKDYQYEDCLDLSLCSELTSLDLTETFTSYLRNKDLLLDVANERIRKYRNLAKLTLIKNKNFSASKAKKRAKKRTNKLFGRGIESLDESTSSLLDTYANVYGLVKYKCE